MGCLEMQNEKRLIDANALGNGIALYVAENTYLNDAPLDVLKMVADWVTEAPTVDAVPIGVLDQVRWERDVAMAQLEEHGIPFGGIAPDVLKVVRCKDCKFRGDYPCPMYYDEWVEWNDDGYHESEWIDHDQTIDDGFCHMGERWKKDAID